jgi:hypothetical protein
MHAAHQLTPAHINVVIIIDMYTCTPQIITTHHQLLLALPRLHVMLLAACLFYIYKLAFVASACIGIVILHLSVLYKAPNKLMLQRRRPSILPQTHCAILPHT